MSKEKKGYIKKYDIEDDEYEDHKCYVYYTVENNILIEHHLKSSKPEEEIKKVKVPKIDQSQSLYLIIKQSVEKALDKNGNDIDDAIKKIISESPKEEERFLNGERKLIGHFIGKVLKSLK